MDPNQERKDACKVCGGYLPKRKSRFCTRLCANRFYHWKRHEDEGYFFVSVAEAVWIPRDEESQRKAGLLIAAGSVLGLMRNGRVAAIGVPLREDEIEAHRTRRRALRRQRLIVARREERLSCREDEQRARKMRRELAEADRG